VNPISRQKSRHLRRKTEKLRLRLLKKYQNDPAFKAEVDRQYAEIMARRAAEDGTETPDPSSDSRD
jgi:hypothetical protein